MESPLVALQAYYGGQALKSPEWSTKRKRSFGNMMAGQKHFKALGTLFFG